MSDNKIHSELGASSYKRWKECPASVNFCRDIPATTSSYAEEGTIAHEVAAARLIGFVGPGAISDEMSEAVKVYTDHVDFLRMCKPTFEAIEQRLDISFYHPELFGTADYICYFAKTKTLHVVDYKHGAGVAVEVVDYETGAPNEQLMYYGLGALHRNKFPISEVILTIVQPRCYHEKGPVRSQTVPANMLLDFAAQLIEDAKKTEDPNAIFKTGDHCRWCRGQATCPEAHKKAITTAKNVFGQTISYDPAKLADTLIKLDQIEAWCKSVRSFAYSEAEAGRIPPGFKLVDKRATRKWKNDVDADKLSRIFSINTKACVEEFIKSPAQMAKLVGQRIFANVESELVIKESSGKNLVPISDNRPSIASKAKDVFEEV